MSLALALARIEQIERALAPGTAASSPPPLPVAAAATAGAGSSSFSNVLADALPSGALMPPGSQGTGAAAMVRIAEGEIGQAEQPPGSNDSPRIAVYRQATGGSGVGPWCAYFVSWVARQAGMPLGDHGQGFGSVDELYAWAQRAGRAVPNGPGVVPHPGDLVVFHEHVGLVESVLPDGRIQTIEGNSSDRVSRNLRPFSDAVGYIRMS